MEVNSQPAPPASPRAFFIHVAVFGVLACVTLGVFFQGILQAPFSLDEIYYLNGSGIVELWRSSDTGTLATSGRFRLYGAPLSSLLAGLSRLAAGMPLAAEYAFPVNSPDPLAVALMPAPEILLAARLPSVFMGMAATLLLAALLWRASGALVGLSVGVLLLLDCQHVTVYRQLMTEPAMLFFTVLALALTLAAARRPSAMRAGLAGLAAGLAMASKHTALLAVGASSATLGLIALARRASWVASAARSLLVVCVAATVLIALNPFTWADPVGSARFIVETRRENFEDAVRDYPTQALSTVEERLVYFTWRVFANRALLGCAPEYARQVGVDPVTGEWRYGAFLPAKLLAYTPLCQPELGGENHDMRPITWVNLGLSVLGVMVILGGAVRRRRGTIGLPILGWMLLFIVATAASVQLTWGQYYVLPTTFAAVLQAVALGAGAQKLIELARRRAGRVGQP